MATYISPSSVLMHLVLEVDKKKGHFYLVYYLNSTFFFFFFFSCFSSTFVHGFCAMILDTFSPWNLGTSRAFTEMNSIYLDTWGKTKMFIWINCGCEVFQVLHVFHENTNLAVDRGTKFHLNCWGRSRVWLAGLLNLSPVWSWWLDSYWLHWHSDSQALRLVTTHDSPWRLHFQLLDGQL